ncbi:hypothetical protein LAUMK136_00447 [Mycobacterium attenuatum]|uniref:STAS domain-containing protein n=1 Tax=Mycobacterium attenuatum TaxID=2341086 RepID=A0A498PNI6_9MYCO|nr:hypothetical protein LAUMK136_00447 [Mycobacterium attenuatum]
MTGVSSADVASDRRRRGLGVGVPETGAHNGSSDLGADERDDLVGDAAAVRRAYDALPLIVGSFEGPQHKLVTGNAAFRAYYPRGVSGVPIEELAPELSGPGLIDYDHIYRSGKSLSVSDFRLHVDLDGLGLKEHYLNITAVPQLSARGEVVGVVFVAADTTKQVVERLTAEQRAREMAGRYESLRDSASVMQRALLSPQLPVLPGADLAAAYLVATEDTAAGGDWFDAIPTSDGSLTLVVGDVVGHGVAAAAVMAQLRTATRIFLSGATDIASALRAVDDFAADIAGAKSATICVVALNTTTGDAQYCTAGHPPPLVIDAHGMPRYLEPTGAGPLGSGCGFPVRTTHLALGDVVLLYTDGIIERPGLPSAHRSTELAEVTARVLRGQAFPLDTGQRAVERVCSHTVELLVRTTGYSDDITLLAAQRRIPPLPLHATMRADYKAERAIRNQLRQWLVALGADQTSGQPLEQAVSEFVANAAEHAYVDQVCGTLHIDAVLGDDGRVRVAVTDHGVWRQPSTPADNRGRGLALAHMLIPDTVVTHDNHGTTVTSTHRLTHSAHIVTDPRQGPGVPAAAPSTTFDVGITDDGYVIVVGDVDTHAASTLAGFLATTSRAGTQELRVDLSAVTHLGSAAVSVLFEATERAARHDTTVTLVAPPGAAAHHVLSLVGLPITVQPNAEL